MTQYWPNAIVVNQIGKPERLFTYSACNSIEQCDKVFDGWKNHYEYKPLMTWIDARYDCGSKKVIHKTEYRQNFYL